MSKLVYSDYYLPSTTVHVKEVLENMKNLNIPDFFPDKEAYIDKFISNSGLENITIEKDANLIDIFTQQLTTLFKKTNIKPEQIKHLIFTSPKHYKVSKDVSVPCYLIERFNLTQASFMVVYQQCASTLRAIEIAKGFNNNDKECYSLILSTSFYRDLDERFAYITVCGDGAGVLLVGKDNTSGVFELLNSTTISSGASSVANHERFIGSRKKDEKLKTDIKANADYRIAIKGITEKNNINFNDIKIFLIQSTSLYYANTLADILEIPKEKIYPKNISNGGHWGDADFIRNYTDVIDKIKFKQGDYMISLFGGADDTGTSVNASLFRYC